MSWIQENKFVAGLAGVTAVLGGAILYFGNSQGNQYDEKVTEYEALKAEYRKLQKSKPFPDAGNLEEKKENIASYEAVINDVRNTFSEFKADQLGKITPEQFNDRYVKMAKELRAAFQDAGTTMPENGTGFGFEKYANNMAKSGATAMLSYEMNAVQWLLSQLAAAKPAELNNIKRDELSVETGQVEPAPPSRGGKRGRGNRGAKPAAESEKAYTLMPVELSFTASESSLREFLKSMVNSKEYFYSIRALRIRNEKQTPPTVKDAGFPAGGGGGGAAPAGGDENDPFAGIAIPDEGDDSGEGEGDDGGEVPVPAPKPVAGNGERILKQVLGSEKLHVFIRFDIVYIKGEEKAAETAAPSKAQP